MHKDDTGFTEAACCEFRGVRCKPLTNRSDQSGWAIIPCSVPFFDTCVQAKRAVFNDHIRTSRLRAAILLITNNLDPAHCFLWPWLGNRCGFAADLLAEPNARLCTKNSLLREPEGEMPWQGHHDLPRLMKPRMTYRDSGYALQLCKAKVVASSSSVFGFNKPFPPEYHKMIQPNSGDNSLSH